MGIDRLYEDDAPDVAQHDSPTAEHDAPNGDHEAPTPERDSETEIESLKGEELEAYQAAYSVTYRETVEVEYQAAWDEALPALRQAWEDHKERYPHPERERPTVQADGSWRGEGDRELKPEQNTEVDRRCERIREIGMKVIVPGMLDVAAEDTSRQLVGFEHRFKGEDRLKEKVADQLRSTPGLTPTQALAVIPDAVRFTYQYRDENSYVTSAQKDIERLEAHGFIQVERRNTWASEQYKGINSRWREPESGLIFEVQFHTRPSLEAKELTHKAYERMRGTAEEPELAELKEFQRRVCAMIPLPAGVAEYENYPPERSDDRRD